MIIWLADSSENTSTPIVLTCLSLLNIIMLIWSAVVSKPKEKKTYTENQTTIVPPADPLDVLAGVPDLLWTIDYASRRVTSHNNNQIPHHPEGSQFAKLAAIFPARVSRQFLEALIELQDKQTALRFEYTLGNEQVQYTFEARLTPLSHRDCVVIIRDISHIKATEAALFQQQMFTQQIIDSSPNLVFIRDQHGRFLLVNQTTQKLLGHDLLVHSHMGLDEDTPILSAGDQSVLNHGETIRIEDSCTLPNGRTHWFDITKLAVEREGKTYILSIANDITLQKENNLAQTDSGLLVRAIANALPHAFLLVQNEQVLFANRAACARLGLEPEQLIGEALSRLNPQSVNLQQCSSYQLHTPDGQCLDCSVCPVEIMQTQGHLLTLQ
ncbi:PAS domain-containing protein [Chitinibacter bivalviorum]|uniref:PAS domain-containing protein n=1 Tax=Chitinibacter bivalviorum TaxID=2739434 RepID=A0A7H9BIV0_9NEIS|nr:PAS domain-containing protein [Chitinibacter bivalviorum]QLG88168.1 PAS domain-containing protein [Chitinibacter bivalviorum]